MMLLLFGVSPGCGFKIEKFEQATPEEVQPEGFESPQAAFAALGKALKAKGLRCNYAVCHRRYRNLACRRIDDFGERF